MAPVVIIEDYYLVLQVDQSATAETIIKSYKKLAFQLHPDRNKKHDAKEAFQLVSLISLSLHGLLSIHL